MLSPLTLTFFGFLRPNLSEEPNTKPLIVPVVSADASGSGRGASNPELPGF
jgi:hypothetical protein